MHSNNPNPDLATKVILTGLHLDLTEALKAAALGKAERLLRHEPRIIRIKIDLEYDLTRTAGDQFIAKGYIDVPGPDLSAHVQSDDAYKSLDLLIAKLDALLRRRHSEKLEKRNHPHPIDLDVPLPKAV